MWSRKIKSTHSTPFYRWFKHELIASVFYSILLTVNSIIIIAIFTFNVKVVALLLRGFCRSLWVWQYSIKIIIFFCSHGKKWHVANYFLTFFIIYYYLCCAFSIKYSKARICASSIFFLYFEDHQEERLMLLLIFISDLAHNLALEGMLP